MKNSILVLSVAVTLLCGALLVQKNRDMAEMRARLAAADQARAASAARAAQEEKRTKSLQKRLHQSRFEASEPARAAVTPARAASDAGNTNRSLSQMYRDVMMKQALQAEAKVAVSKSVQKLFDAGLASGLQLNQDQSAALRQLLTQRASIMWEQMFVPMATGQVDAGSMASTGQAIKQEIDQNASQIRDLLGDDGYNTFQWFEKTQPERDEANEFNQAAADAGLQLASEQQSQLLDLMTTERANFNFQYDIGDPQKMDFEHWFDNFTEEKINGYQQDMEQLNGSIVQQAQAVLTPEQSAQLNQFLARHLFQSLVTIRSTVAMMSGNNP
jgi:hypothetical protein